MRPLSEGSRLRRFLLVTFGWSWPLQVLSLWLSPLQRKVVLGVSMWAPALGALAATGGPWRDAVRRLFRPPGLPGGHARVAIVAAFLLPPATVVAAVALSVWLGVARLNPAHPPWRTLAVLVIGAACVAPVANFPVCGTRRWWSPGSTIPGTRGSPSRSWSAFQSSSTCCWSGWPDSAAR
ncbi:MAG: hypothetical protein ACJ8F1_04755 [Polyangia bacterium]